MLYYTSDVCLGFQCCFCREGYFCDYGLNGAKCTRVSTFHDAKHRVVEWFAAHTLCLFGVATKTISICNVSNPET